MSIKSTLAKLSEWGPALLMLTLILGIEPMKFAAAQGLNELYQEFPSAAGISGSLSNQNSSTLQTTTEPVEAPGFLTVTPLTSTTLEFHWPQTAEATKYELAFYRGSEVSWYTKWAIHRLEPTTRYYINLPNFSPQSYRVVLKAISGTYASPGVTQSFTIPATSAYQPLLEGPAYVSTRATSDTEIEVRVPRVSGVTGFVLEQRSSGLSGTQTTTVNSSSDWSGDEIVHKQSNLDPDLTYTMGVRLKNHTGTGAITYSTPTTTRQQVRYYLNHGIGDTTANPEGMEAETAFFNSYRPGGQSPTLATPMSLQPFLTNTPRAGVESPAVQWRDKNLYESSKQLADRIQRTGSPSSVENIVIVGYSQGQARSRYFLQQLATQAQYLGVGQKVRALVSINGVNHGSPIVANAAPALTFIGSVVGAAVATDPRGALSIAGLVGWGAAGGTLGGFLINGPLKDIVAVGQGAPQMAGQDATPGPTKDPAFFRSLNVPSASTFKPIPQSVAVLEIVGGGGATTAFDGQGNNFDQFIAQGGVPLGTRDTIATLATVMAGIFWAGAWFFGLTLPAAIAWTALALLLWTLPTFWKRFVVGSNDGDGIMPLDKQYIYRPGNTSDMAIGGNKQPSVFVPDGFHSGSKGTYENSLTRIALCNLQDALDFEASNTCPRRIP